jgi:hypothetical protein
VSASIYKTGTICDTSARNAFMVSKPPNYKEKEERVLGSKIPFNYEARSDRFILVITCVKVFQYGCDVNN